MFAGDLDELSDVFRQHMSRGEQSVVTLDRSINEQEAATFGNSPLSGMDSMKRRTLALSAMTGGNHSGNERKHRASFGRSRRIGAMLSKRNGERSKSKGRSNSTTDDVELDNNFVGRYAGAGFGAGVEEGRAPGKSNEGHLTRIAKDNRSPALDTIYTACRNSRDPRMYSLIRSCTAKRLSVNS